MDTVSLSLSRRQFQKGGVQSSLATNVRVCSVDSRWNRVCRTCYWSTHRPQSQTAQACQLTDKSVRFCIERGDDFECSIWEKHSARVSSGALQQTERLMVFLQDMSWVSQPERTAGAGISFVLGKRRWRQMPTRCRCGRLDVFGHHWAACPIAGVLGQRGFAIESVRRGAECAPMSWSETWESLSWAMPANWRLLLMVSTGARTRADERDYFRTFRSTVCIDFTSFQLALLPLRCHLGKFLVSCVHESLFVVPHCQQFTWQQRRVFRRQHYQQFS